MSTNESAGLFFTGTDTGVGKTFVAAAAARRLRQQGCSVRVCKPVATGARCIKGRWVSEDTLRLAEAAGMEKELAEITPWAFPEPVAPPVAARFHGITLTIDETAAAVRRQARPGGILLVEGIGGLLCPLTEAETVADLAKAVGFPLVVVARRSLGTLNHTLLTLEAARIRGLPVAGLVINETTPSQTLAEEMNVDELRRRVAVPLLAVIPHQPQGAISPDAVAAIDWRQLPLR